jgi:hypothetical protein
MMKQENPHQKASRCQYHSLRLTSLQNHESNKLVCFIKYSIIAYRERKSVKNQLELLSIFSLILTAFYHYSMSMAKLNENFRPLSKGLQMEPWT